MARSEDRPQQGAEFGWGYHVAPAILVATEDQGGIWMIIDPSLMDGPATLPEWKTAMKNPDDAWFDIQDMDTYWPTNLPRFAPAPEGYDVEYADVSTGKPIGGPHVDSYLATCVDAGHCQGRIGRN